MLSSPTVLALRSGKFALKSLGRFILRTLVSVNSQLLLISSERPPSYEAVARADLVYVPPPAYHTVFSV